MQKLLLIACAVLMTACETAPPTIEHDFETFEAIDKEVAHPIGLPSIAPLECWPSEDDCQVVGYSRGTDVDALELYKVTSDGNFVAAQYNAEALEFMLDRDKAILAAAKAQESITRLREEQLAWERSERIREKWYYRIMLILVGAAGVAAAN